jgi:hypothetical protein
MTKSPAHWEQPASDKGSAAQEQKQLRPGKSDLKAPRDSDWHYAGKPQRRQPGSGRLPQPARTQIQGD